MHNEQSEFLQAHWYLYRLFPLRPVAARWVRRQRGLPVGPPTDEERHDAVLLLEHDIVDDVGDEAFRILDEYGQ